MSVSVDMTEVFKNELTVSKRPLSVRRLLKLCHQRGEETQGLTVASATRLLRNADGVSEIRKGVFTIGDQTVAKSSVQESSDEAVELLGEERGRANRTLFPRSLDEAVELRASLGGRAALRDHLRKKLRQEFLPHEKHDANEVKHESTEMYLHTAKARPSDEPYVERREEKVTVQQEQRVPKVDTDLSGLGAKIQETLQVAERPLSLEALQSHLAKNDGSCDVASIRMTVFVENERCRHQGLREPFIVGENGGIGLTSWGLPSRFLELENRVLEARHEQTELVKRALLHRLSELSSDGFLQALRLMFERNGVFDCQRLDTVRTEGFVLKAEQRRGTGSESVLIEISQTWAQLEDKAVQELQRQVVQSGLSGGIFIALGTYSEHAVAQADNRTLPKIQLIDGEVLASLFYRSRVGLRSATWTFCYPDLSFFKGLADV